jgi:hypothetical protein
MPQGVGAQSGCSAEFSGPQGPLRVGTYYHEISINLGIDSRVKSVYDFGAVAMLYELRR